MSEATTKLAICAIIKNEDLYVDEWIAFHLLQGASEILIFDNQSTDGTKETLANIARYAPVSVVNWPGDNYHEMQLNAYHEGAMRLCGKADWAAFIDIDEFLFSSRSFSMPAELEHFGTEVGAVAVGHRIFGSCGHTAYEPDLVTSRFARCARPDHPQLQWFKTIARPELIDRFDSSHSVVLTTGAYLLADHTPLQCDNPEWHPGHADRVANGTISLFHYMVKSLEEYHWKQNRFGDKKMEYRYTDEFFYEHDKIGDEMDNFELCRFADPIRAMILQWR
jgi:Glycosyl transferase family 2